MLAAGAGDSTDRGLSSRLVLDFTRTAAGAEALAWGRGKAFGILYHTPPRPFSRKCTPFCNIPTCPMALSSLFLPRIVPHPPWTVSILLSCRLYIDEFVNL